MIILYYKNLGLSFLLCKYRLFSISPLCDSISLYVKYHYNLTCKAIPNYNDKGLKELTHVKQLKQSLSHRKCSISVHYYCYHFYYLITTDALEH